MNDEEKPAHERDVLLERIGEAAIRLMAGAVPRPVVEELRTRVAQTDPYPWEMVVDEVLAQPADRSALIQQGLRAQRDWILGVAPRAPQQKRPARTATRAKTLLAIFLSRVIFFTITTVVLCVLLILLKFHWPQIDIYVVLEWLKDAFPGVFGPG